MTSNNVAIMELGGFHNCLSVAQETQDVDFSLESIMRHRIVSPNREAHDAIKAALGDRVKVDVSRGECRGCIALQQKP